MVRKAVRTYSQILTDFARADEEDARIRAFYEPSGARAAVRPSADPDLQKQRPVSAARKHRYAHMLDWNDDVSAIVNVDKHDGGARVGTLAAAFAADRKGNASRALTAALNCAMETASRLQQLPPAPTTSHTSRLAMRLLRAAQTPLPVPISPPGSTTATPRPDMPTPFPSGTDPHHNSDPIAASTGLSGLTSTTSRPSSPQCATGRPPSSAAAAAAASPAQDGAIFIPAGSANLDLEEQQHLAIASGTLLNSSARMLYYGSTKPRVSSARGRASSLSSSGGGDGSSRPVSAPSHKSNPPLSSSTQTPHAPPMLQIPLGRASLTATWAPSPASVRSRPNSALPGSVRLSASGSAVAATCRQTSPLVSPSSRRRSTTASVVTLSFQATVPAAAAAASSSPRTSEWHRTHRSSFSSFGNVGGGGDATEMAPSVSVETARSLGMNPRQLHQVQPKHGPSNGVFVRDPVGPQLIPNRRIAITRPVSAPPCGNAVAAYDGEAAAEPPPVSTQWRGNPTQQQQQVWPPSPSWQPNTGSSPPMQQQQQQQRGSVSLQRQSGSPSPSPQRRAMRHDESFRSVASEHTITSAPSCGSVAVAAAAAAANAAVSSGIALARRRNAALVGARKALWSQIADAAGVQPYEAQHPDGGVLDGAAAAGSRSGGGGEAAAAGSSPYLEAYLAQQAVVGSSSGASSRMQLRMDCPEHLRSTQQCYHSHLSHNHPSSGDSESGGSFGMEPSAAYLIASASLASASIYASTAVLDDPDTTAVTGDPSEPSATAATASSGSHKGSEQEGGSSDGAQASHRAGGGSRGQGSVLRVPSVIKRRPGGPGGSGGGPGNDDAGDATTTPSGSKRVQWGANVWSPRHRIQQHNAAVPTAGFSTDAASELDRASSGIQLSPNGSAGGAVSPPADLGRPPRYPALAPLGVGSDMSGGELVFPAGATSPMSSISPGLLPSSGHHPARKRPPSRLQTERDPDDDDGDSDLPSLEVSTAAGVLDRAAQSPRALDTRCSGSAGGAEAPLPYFTDPEFYQLTALVDRTEDVQGWLFNVYLTDITPGNPLARRVCIATCTTADEHKQLLVPPPPAARLCPAAATSQDQSTPSPRPLRPLPPSPLISPPELLPWVSRPEQLFGHWLRLEAFAIAPVADKVVDAMTYMGRLDTDLPPPPQPKLSKLHVVDIRPAAAAAAHAAAAAAAATSTATAGATVFNDAGGSSSNSRSRPSSASSVSTLAAALGRQQLSSAGNAAQAQARPAPVSAGHPPGRECEV
ncbi:hypothetical protein Vafri_13041 [Volvox africanus]|uniref:Uncharacterized protein n=1 Tax=Volvox africanus TaxID=51714 RepID=A0A8J4BB85_9CHLO|nr:hypothetical protein Vafri_13041 [Volvox africanus]